MKKFLLSVATLAITSISIAQSFQNCPTSFKRSNGGGGGCSFAKLTLVYSSCPTEALPIDSVYQSGVKINTTFAPGVISCSGSRYEVTYCISANIAPVGFLTIYFHAAGAYDGNTCTVPSSTGGPLPVKLTDFYAKRNSSVISLSWKTETEVNAAFFILEKKAGSGDFKEVATIKATNNINGSSYSYADVNSSNTVSQYRLKMIDFDGTYSYSEIRTVKGTLSVSDFTVFPNPSTGNAKVTVADISEPTDIQLIDNSGRVLKNIPMNNSNTVNLTNLQSGSYMIRIINRTSGENLTKKITVLN